MHTQGGGRLWEFDVHWGEERTADTASSSSPDSESEESRDRACLSAYASPKIRQTPLFSRTAFFRPSKSSTETVIFRKQKMTMVPRNAYAS